MLKREIEPAVKARAPQLTTGKLVISASPTNPELLTLLSQRTSMILWGFYANGQVRRQN